MNEKALVVEAYEAGIGHAVVALIEERDAEWARATDAETLERLASQRLAEAEAERDKARAEVANAVNNYITASFERDALRAQLDAATAVMRQYENWYDGAPEDSWRLERDMMAALGLEPLA